MKILVAGGSGGIGRAFVEEIVHEMPEAQVHATFFRSSPDSKNSPENNNSVNSVQWHRSDLTDADSVEQLADSVGPIDWIINASGMLHTPTQMPEKSITQIDSDFFHKTMAVNVLSTLFLARYFLKNFKGSECPRFVALSARVGSIEDNRVGGWYSYRASKSALNMVLKTLSHEWRRKKPDGCIVAIHPGTVDTQLTEPFKKNVPPEKLFSSQHSAQRMLEVIRRLSSEQTGQFLAYDGSLIPW
ncbi:SDR family NAD(P)-dependent oxidoreductase [Endozoicomonas sp. 2B-B]